jgi:hypothetical protein
MGEYITATMASRRFAISEKTIRNWIKMGKLPAQKIKIDGLDQWQIDTEDIEQVVNRKSTGMPPEEMIARFELIEQRLDAIEQRLDAMTRPRPQEQPPAEAVAPVRAALASLMKLTPAPDEPMRLNQFCDLHAINRNEAERLYGMGLIAGTREPGKGRRKGSIILSAKGMHDFWVQFKDHAEFRKCDTCPH